MSAVKVLGNDRQGNSIVLDESNTNIGYHLLETPNLIELVQEILDTIDTNGSDQIVVERDLGRSVGTTLLVETDATDEIVYAKRIGRDAYSRFTKSRAPVPTSWIVVVLRKVDDGYILWTAMCGRLLPPEAYDLNSDFNKTHAMAYSESLVQLDTVVNEL